MKRYFFAFACAWHCLAYPAAGGSLAFSYDPAGRLTKAVFAEDKAIHYSYNSAGNLLQRHIGPDAEPDSNGDGIPDSWYSQYGLDPNDPNIANVDSDDDGLTNGQEYLLGTNPIDATSTFKVLPNPATSGGGVTVHWLSVPGKTYRLQYKENVNDLAWTDVPGDVTASGATASKVDSTAPATRRFYQVRLVQ